MVIAMSIDNNGKKVEENIKNLGLSLGKELQEAGYEYTKLAAKNLRLQLQQNESVWDGKTLRSIKANRKTKNISNVTIRKEGLFLDRAKPHYVSIFKGSKISRWVRDKYGSKVKTGLSRVKFGPRGGVIGGRLYVTPTPFINLALGKTHTEYPRIMKDKLRNVRG
jgi:hypothetical protein